MEAEALGEALNCTMSANVSLIKSLRKGRIGPCFLQAAPTQAGLQSRVALGIAQLGSKLTVEGDREGPHPDH